MFNIHRKDSKNGSCDGFWSRKCDEESLQVIIILENILNAWLRFIVSYQENSKIVYI